MSDDGALELFEEPAQWRAEAARALGYDGLDLAAAVAPGAGFPTMLVALARHLDVGPGQVVVDVGAGLGGASAWIRELTGARVIAVEPADRSRRAARDLFPQLAVRDGEDDDLPAETRAADAVTAIGVCSLLEDLSGLVDEVTRVLRPGGRLGIADLFLRDGTVRRVGPNTLRSVREMSRELIARGFDLVEVAAGPPEPSARWRTLADAVEAEIARAHSADEQYDAWKVDQEHLASLVADGVVMSGCVVARLVSAET